MVWPSGEDVQPSEAQTTSMIGKPRSRTKTLQMFGARTCTLIASAVFAPQFQIYFSND